MTVLSASIVGILMGLVFGFALEKSRVFEPGIIIKQFQLQNFTMLKVFLSAVVSGLIVLSVLSFFDLTKLHPKATFYGADIVGGLLLGAGIVLAGACPGTVLAQIGAGYKDAWWTFLGGLGGALTFIYLQPTIAALFLQDGAGKITFNTMLDVPYYLVAVPLAAVLILILMGLEKWKPYSAEITDNLDGTNI